MRTMAAIKLAIGLGYTEPAIMNERHKSDSNIFTAEGHLQILLIVKRTFLRNP